MSDALIETLPKLKSSSLPDAKAWFGELADLGALWHPDDSPETVTGWDGRSLFSPEAAREAAVAIRSLREGTRNWPDRDFLYDMSSAGRFEVEREHPEFVVDAGVPGALRSGYVSLHGQELPTLVVENGNVFVAVQFGTATGTVSGSRDVTVIPVDGASFDGADGMDVSRATLRLEDAVVVEGPYSASALEEAIDALCGFAPAPGL